MLEIDKENKEYKKGIRSICIDNNYEEDISSIIEKRRVCTPYTISTPKSIETVLNDSARENKLIFQMELDESVFTDPNVPVYFHEGKDTIKINLFPYKYGGVEIGGRNKFLGAITAQMLFLNSEPNNLKPEIRQAIFNFILSINRQICRPNLDMNEVIILFNSNCKRFQSGNINIDNYYVKQRAFWSRNSTLKGNDKRKVTCKIKNEPIVAESRRKIISGIEIVQAQKIKVTQQAVADAVENLSLGTVKKYRNYYNELLGRIKSMSGENENSTLEDNRTAKNNEIVNDNNSTIIKGYEIPKEEKGINKQSIRKHSDSNLQMIFQRIFKVFLKNIDVSSEQTLFSNFLTRFNELSVEDQEILSFNQEDCKTGDTYWSQDTLDRQFWDLINEVQHYSKDQQQILNE